MKKKVSYGHFAGDGKAYVITDWNTPRPWINVISNGTWGLTISQTGGGYSWLEHSMLNRITRWHQDILQDPYGKYFFLRDEETGRTWSLTPQPLQPEYDQYSCTHGMGHTSFNTEFNAVAAELLVYVPLDLSCEMWLLRLTNVSKKIKKLSLITYLDLLLGVFPDWHREFSKLFIKTSYDAPHNSVIANSTLWAAPLPGDAGWNKDWPYTAFFTASEKLSSFTCDKEEFFCRYNAWPQAQAWKLKKFSGLCGMGMDQIISVMQGITLKPGQTKELNFCLGVLPREDFKKGFPRYVQAVRKDGKKLLSEVKAHWQELCSRLTVKTEEPEVDAMLNYWLKYQAISGRLLGRTAYYQCGGAFGFRDQLQDSQIYLALEPGKTKQKILMHAGHQRKDGIVQHWWHPISEEGRINEISDNLLWLPFVAINYLKETSDFAALDEKAPYLDGGEGTLFEHCSKAMEKALERRSSRGLSLIGEGDWNDGLNGVGVKWKGESIWLTAFLHGILRDFADICRRAGKSPELARLWEQEAQNLKGAALTQAWDGKWFILATRDDGGILGSQNSKQGKIHLNPQTWAVINGLVEGDKAKAILAECEKYLYKDYGVLLFTPAYSVVDKNIGYLTRYAPGTRENGGVYTHAATWAIIAQAAAGNTAKVYDTFRRMFPPFLSKSDPNRYKGEPYVTPGNIEGPESYHEGTGAWTWYSGSAAWLYRAVTEHLFGVRVEYDKLVVRPNLPAHWKGFVMERLHNGKKIRITVSKPVGKVTDKYDVKIEDAR